LLPADFLLHTTYPQLRHYPRYLRAMKLRSERARLNPAKERERAALLAPYVKVARELADRPGADRLRWLVEEWRVSLFAQELGTAEPVSTVKLDREIAALRASVPESAPPPAPAPAAVRPVTTPGKKPVKSLAALDRLFRP
jgi:ATP-dependent helicase HrpA